ncbi:MAG: hypothetical protein NC038_06010 [Paludibacter sp.]|nr:hypothetical protein [Bacteroidales bacterium]MCM1069299.1 hypothetical protein [Prevotella sp.]MCM1353718.1 hypothetical protein [Bacteroides sp.]MCM1442214.1 hypothetical protein [Muribaculum sp.]MCM1482176.1 hypothetical protein [Paludibacter sp.]
MKKSVLVMALMSIMSITTVRAFEFPGFEWGVGADITSSYLWRGMRYGGLAFQPDVNIGFGGLSIDAWWNLSPYDYTFTEFNPEMDITLSYAVAGLKIGATHYYYFDGSKYFGFKDAENTSQLEVFAEYNLGDVVEAAPLHIGWYTLVAGDDMYEVPGATEDAAPVRKRAYSSYVDVSFDINLPLNFTLTPTVGMTPWKSFYTGYEGDFAVNNVSLKLNWELNAGKHFCMDIYAIGMLNTYGINKENLVPEVKNSYANQRLNGAIGIGIWLF